jgi:hypothetical protein
MMEKIYKFTMSILLSFGCGHFAYAINVNWEMTEVQEVSDSLSKITFSKKGFGGGTVVVSDDDGMAMLTYLQYSMMQKYSEDMYMNQKKWSEVQTQKVDDFPKFKSEIMKSLKKSTSYASDLLKDLNRQYLETSDARKKALLKEQIGDFTKEQRRALELYDLFKDKPQATVGELSDNIGVFVSEFGKMHSYDNLFSSGSTEKLALFENHSNNPIGQLMISRPIVLKDNFLISRSRSDLNISPDVIKSFSNSGDSTRKTGNSH